MTDDLDRPEPEQGYGLVMPFVVCASQGGPYEDGAFVAGYQAGRLDSAMAAIAAVQGDGMSTTIYRALVPQLDLLAMHHGFPHTTAKDFDEENPDKPVFGDWVQWSCSRHEPNPEGS